jgi:predicted nucleic-acid-binding Zn-ribbon protein
MPGQARQTDFACEERMMDTAKCPKCEHAMDDGVVSPSSEGLGHLSKKQTGMLRAVTNIRVARACTNCGYVEMYLDPAELKKRIG